MQLILRMDHLEVRTKILTNITIGISRRINVGHPKKLFRNCVIILYQINLQRSRLKVPNCGNKLEPMVIYHENQWLLQFATYGYLIAQPRSYRYP